MTEPMIRSYRLVSRGGAGLCCDELGLALGPMALNKVVVGAAGWRYELSPKAHVTVALRSAYGMVSDEVVDRYHRGLVRVCELLSRGNAALARIYAVQMVFPEIEPAGMTKLARSAEWLKFNPHWMDEFRNRGEFSNTPGELRRARFKGKYRICGVQNSSAHRRPEEIYRRSYGGPSARRERAQSSC